jgi:uncharacterized protein (DUF885 family)
MVNKRFLISLSCSLIYGLLMIHQVTAQVKKPELKTLFEQYYQENLKLDPLSATFSGDHRYDGQLANDGSSSYLKTKYQFDKKYLRLLGQYNRAALATTDKISYDVLHELLSIDLDRSKFHFEYMPINQFSSTPLLFGQLGSGNSGQPFKTVNDYENWIKRIADFKLWTDTAIANMRRGIKTGIVLPRVLVIKMIPQMETLADPDSGKNVLFNPVKHIPASFSSTEKSRLKAQCFQTIRRQLVPSYQRLASFLKNEYLPHATASIGLSALPQGAEMYKYYIRYYTTTNQSPDDIYQTGLNEVARITAAMEKVKKQTGFNGSLQDFFKFLRTDKRFMPFKTPEQVLQAYRNIYAKIKPHLNNLFGIQPKAAFEIKRVEAFREASQNGPSYMIGAPDGSRPGIFYVPITDATKINVTFLGMEATFLHEAIPGHHYQISLQQENPKLPSFRHQISFSAYTEGWGLYVESLGKELGCYTDPYQEMGALNNEIHRAIRLVADVGIHTGKMSEVQAIAYMMNHESISREDAVLSAERYMAIPGQALSYKVGELEIKRLRDKYRNQLGVKFSLKKFHDTLLSQGDMPLTVLDNYMDEWAHKQ